MAQATGKRLAASLLLGVSLFPPWIHALLTLPMGLALWRSARQQEEERERELAALEE